MVCDVNQVDVLIVLLLCQKSLYQAFGVVEHMKATHASFILLEDGDMLDLFANGVCMELDANVIESLLECDGWYLHESITE